MKSAIAFVLTSFLLIAPQSGVAEDNHRFADHGLAADVSRHHGAGVVVNGDGQRVFLAWLHSTADISKIAVNVDTGETVQFNVAGPPAGCGGPFKSLRSSRNLWYSHFSGYFYEFSPELNDFSHVEALDPGTCAMSAMEDAAGVVWMALYPTAELVSFDPETRKLLKHGKLNDETWPQYPQQGLAMDDAGWVYTGIGNVLAQVVGYDPQTGDIRRYIERDERKTGSGRVFRGQDGHVYATAPEWGWHVMFSGHATPIQSPPVEDAQHHWGRASSSDGLPVLAWPDGSRIDRVRIEERYLVVHEADGTERRVEFDHKSAGALIFGMVTDLASDVIYGLTGAPEYIFRFKPETGEIEHKALWGGRWNSIAVHEDRLFGAVYPIGWLTSFGFDAPLDPGQEPDSNPRRYAQAWPHIDRPSVLIAHPDGRHMVMGGTPGYGRTGGGLFIYDLEQHEVTILGHEELHENLSTCSLVALRDGNLVGGTTTQPGTGGETLAAEAVLYIFDWEQREVVWSDVVLPGRTMLIDMVLGDDGLVYGMANDATLFVFDPEARDIVHKESLADHGLPAGLWWQAPRMMIAGPDRNIYALFRESILRIEPGSFQHTKLADSPTVINTGIALLGGRIYFGSGSHLWSFEIPQ